MDIKPPIPSTWNSFVEDMVLIEEVIEILCSEFYGPLEVIPEIVYELPEVEEGGIVDVVNYKIYAFNKIKILI